MPFSIAVDIAKITKALTATAVMGFVIATPIVAATAVLIKCVPASWAKYLVSSLAVLLSILPLR